MNETGLVPIPTLGEINTHCSAAQVATMEEILGWPNLVQGRPSSIVARHLVTASVGPFRVTGFDLFVDVVAEVFGVVRIQNPGLYEMLGTAGCLDVRPVRGTLNTPSNHAWGTAIDLKVGGILPPRGATECPEGFLALYEAFKAHGLATGDWVFWGAGFPTPDSMHFEASDQLVRKWHAQGLV
jgi:hypothetical protein